MKRDDLRRLFAQARKLSGETDFVVLGSLAALGYAGEIPARMAMSIDVDAYGKSDPARVFTLAPLLGQGSAFESEHGFYLDPVSPRVATLPEGWQQRLVRIELEPGADPFAVARFHARVLRDRGVVRLQEPGGEAGLEAGILSLSILEARFRDTAFLDDAESARARKAFAEDREWLRAKRRRRP